MDIILRSFRDEDAAQVREVIRDANESLRESNGGQHPDEAIDNLIRDAESRFMPRNGSFLKGMMVAEVKETGQVVGTGAIIRRSFDRLLGSAYSTAHYVRRDFQRGRSGVNIGSLLRNKTTEMARAEGCRKIYGFSTPEAIPFHKKFGAVFFPRHDGKYLYPRVRLHYYEIELRSSIFNGLRLEPHMHGLFEGIVLLKVGRMMASNFFKSLLSSREREAWLEMAKAIISPGSQDGQKGREKKG